MSKLKLCKHCETEKELSEFSKHAGCKFGVNSKCKECVKSYYKKYYSENKQKILKSNKEWYENNKDLHQQFVKDWSYNNPDKIRKIHKRYRDKNKDKICYWSAKRRSRMKNSTLENYLDEVKEIYKKCTFINMMCYRKYEVDHIVPLQGKNVCGLHVPWNLQILTKEDNIKKGNKYE